MQIQRKLNVFFTNTLRCVLKLSEMTEAHDQRRSTPSKNHCDLPTDDQGTSGTDELNIHNDTNSCVQQTSTTSAAPRDAVERTPAAGDEFDAFSTDRYSSQAVSQNGGEDQKLINDETAPADTEYSAEHRGNTEQVARNNVSRHQTTRNLVTPNPDRPAILRDLELESLSPSLGKPAFPTTSTGQITPEKPNQHHVDTPVMPTPTPIGSLSLPKSPSLQPDSTNITPKSPPKSPVLSATSSSTPVPCTPKSRSIISSNNITPVTSNDEYGVYSDSDNASLDKPTRRRRDETPSKRKKLRRKSNRSDTPSSFIGSGYTSMPGTGKIFRNLLILEESLREQVIQQRALRRKYLIFLAVLCSLIASISHHLFMTDAIHTSTGTKRVFLQLILLALIVTLMLYHLSGEYQKTIVLPRKFLSSTNKGLRQLNIRLVKIVTPWTDTFTDLIREILLYIVVATTELYHKISPGSIRNKNSRIEVFLITCQSQCQPRIGVTDVKLVLNARVFNTDVREGWELYRSEFWVNEGVRRRQNMLLFINEDNKESPRRVLKKDKERLRKKSNAPRMLELQLGLVKESKETNSE